MSYIDVCYHGLLYIFLNIMNISNKLNNDYLPTLINTNYIDSSTKNKAKDFIWGLRNFDWMKIKLIPIFLKWKMR